MKSLPALRYLVVKPLISMVAGITIVAPAFASGYSLSAHSDGSDKPIISGATNLPDGTQVLITLSRHDTLYYRDRIATVVHGAFSAGPFRQGQFALNPGEYQLQVTPIPLSDQTQPAASATALSRSGADYRRGIQQGDLKAMAATSYVGSIQVYDAGVLLPGTRAAGR